MKAWMMIPFSIVVLADTARADQCQWVDDSVAARAQALVERSPSVIAFCEPCGDAVPGVPDEPTRVTIDRPSGEWRELHINGKGVDLAYTYVQASERRYDNLALLAGCPADGVSPSLTVESETPAGVLITASDEALPPPPPVTEPAFAEPPPPPPAPISERTVYMYSTTTERVPWLALALATAGGVLAGLGFALTLISMRRRRAMRPRAADLRG